MEFCASKEFRCVWNFINMPFHQGTIHWKTIFSLSLFCEKRFFGSINITTTFLMACFAQISFCIAIHILHYFSHICFDYVFGSYHSLFAFRSIRKQNSQRYSVNVNWIINGKSCNEIQNIELVVGAQHSNTI